MPRPATPSGSSRPATPSGRARTPAPFTPTRSGRTTPATAKRTLAPASTAQLTPRSSASALRSSASGDSDVFTSDASFRAKAAARAAEAMRSVDTDSSDVSMGDDDEQSVSIDTGSVIDLGAARERTRSPSISGSDGFDTAREMSAGDVVGYGTPRPQSTAMFPPRRSRTPAPGETDGSSENIVVCVRNLAMLTRLSVRPYGDAGEPAPGDPADIWDLDIDQNRIGLTERHPLLEKRGGTASTDDAYDFRFDALIPPSETTFELYNAAIARVIRATVEGFNGTVFAYGQTGSGKTHSMMGTDDEPGVIPLAIQEVFDYIASDTRRKYLLRVSYLEIYNEQLKDLLGDRSAKPAKLEIRETSGRMEVSGAYEEIVSSPIEVIEALQRGENSRHVGATDWNHRSSRSHCVFTLTIESCEVVSADSTASISSVASGPIGRSKSRAGGRSHRVSQLNLIDLAGSELATSQAERRMEGKFINKSLLALKQVIQKLTDKKLAGSHIPYRDSKLTRLLETSLGGNARVAIICTASPDRRCAVETVSTLRFARDAKKVETQAKRGHVVGGEGASSALMATYEREMAELRAQIDRRDAEMAERDEERRRLGELRDERDRAQDAMVDLKLQTAELNEQLERYKRMFLSGNGGGVEKTPAEIAAERKHRRISDRAFGLGTPGGRVVSGGGPRIVSHQMRLMTPVPEVENLRTQVAQSDARVAELEAEIQTLTDRLDFLSVEHGAELAAARSQLAVALEGIDRRDEAAKAYAAEIVAETAAWTAKLEAMQAQLDASAAQLQQRDGRIDSLQSSLDETKSALSAQISLASSSLDDSAREASQRLAAVTCELAAVRASAAEAAQAAARDSTQLQSERDAARSDVSARDGKLAELKASLAEAQRATETARIEANEAKATLADQQALASSAVNERNAVLIKQLADARGSSASEIAELKRAVASAESARTALQGQVDAADRRVKSLQPELDAALRRIKALEADLLAATSRADSLAADSAALNQARRERDEARSKQVETAFLLTERDDTIAEHERSILALRSAREDEHAATAALEQHLGRLTNEAAELRAENDKLKEPKRYTPTFTPSSTRRDGPSVDDLRSRVQALASSSGSSTASARHQRMSTSEIDQNELERQEQVIESQSTIINDLRAKLRLWADHVERQQQALDDHVRSGCTGDPLPVPRMPKMSPSRPLSAMAAPPQPTVPSSPTMRERPNYGALALESMPIMQPPQQRRRVTVERELAQLSAAKGVGRVQQALPQPPSRSSSPTKRLLSAFRSS